MTCNFSLNNSCLYSDRAIIFIKNIPKSYTHKTYADNDKLLIIPAFLSINKNSIASFSHVVENKIYKPPSYITSLFTNNINRNALMFFIAGNIDKTCVLRAENIMYYLIYKVILRNKKHNKSPGILPSIKDPISSLSKLLNFNTSMMISEIYLCMYDCMNFNCTDETPGGVGKDIEFAMCDALEITPPDISLDISEDVAAELRFRLSAVTNFIKEMYNMEDKFPIASLFNQLYEDPGRFQRSYTNGMLNRILFDSTDSNMALLPNGILNCMYAGSVVYIGNLLIINSTDNVYTPVSCVRFKSTSR